MNGLKTPMNWGMPAPALPADYASMSTYGAMPAVDYGLDYSGGFGSTGFNPNSMGGIGFQANGSTIATPNLTGGIGGGGGSGSGWSWLNTRDQQGVLGPAIAGVSALGSMYLGMKQYNLAKDSLAFQKDAFAKNFETQKTLTNSQLEDRQRARVASNAGAYQSVGDYMNQNGVK
jgi:hypothetical protein